MAKLRPIGFALLLAAAGCANQTALGPARSTGPPFAINNRELETPNSLPPGFTTVNPMAPDTGIVGVARTGPL